MKTIAQRKTQPSKVEKKHKAETQHQNPFLNVENAYQDPFKTDANLQQNPFSQGQTPTSNPFSVDTVQKKEDNGNGLPPQVQTQMEQSFGTDFSDVKIQKDSPKAQKMGALAFTQGSDVHFAKGKFEPESKKGQALIGHELAHVVQQRSGKVKPELNLGGVPVNADQQLEAEADQQGAKAANLQPISQNKLAQSTPNASHASQAPVQGFFGNLVKKGLGVLKSKVVDMIPQEYKDMIPPEIRNMADELTNKGIDMAGDFAEQKGTELAQQAKTKLAEAMPPQLVEMANNMPPELRTYIEGLLEKGGQLAEGSLGEGRLPSGDELKQFGKDAATGGIDVAKELVPQAIPDDIKDLINKLPPEVKEFGQRQVEKGLGSIKDGIQNGEMPDIKAFGEEALDDAKGVGKQMLTDAAKEKVNEYLDKLPPDVKNIILDLIPPKEKAAIL